MATKQAEYLTLKPLGVDDTAIDWAGTDQTTDRVEDKGETVDAPKIPVWADAAVIIMHGEHGSAAENKTMAWELVGWRYGGPAEYLAHGTAILGTQAVVAATQTELWADTIAITGQAWLGVLSPVDSGNDRIAKLPVDLYGLSHIALVMQKTTTTTTGAKIAFIAEI